MIILLAGRQGLIGDITQKLVGEKLVFAYSIETREPPADRS
jgi:putative spermidine/putrescine transport system permease protein